MNDVLLVSAKGTWINLNYYLKSTSKVIMFDFTKFTFFYGTYDMLILFVLWNQHWIINVNHTVLKLLKV